MSNYYERSRQALQLAGMSPGTQQIYTDALRRLVEFCGKPPEAISEPELEAYFRHRIEVNQWATGTLRICYSAIKFYFRNVLQRDWQVFVYLRARHETRLPAVLSPEEVHRLLARFTVLHNYTFFATVYSCGLRFSEALALQTTDVDGQRAMVHVHRGKGAKDRYVPLPQETLELLRRYWRTHRNPTLLFPARGPQGCQAPQATTPMSAYSLRRAFHRARTAAGITKRAVSIHTLRHSYATHLLEAGVHVHAIQRYLGHGKLETTMVYFHLTRKGSEDACRLVNQVMTGLDHGQRR